MTSNQKLLLEELEKEERKRDLEEYNDLKKKVKTFGMYTKKEMQKMQTRYEYLKRKYGLDGASIQKYSNLKSLKNETIYIQQTKNKKENIIDKNISEDVKLIEKEAQKVEALLLWQEIVEVQRKLNNAKDDTLKEKLEIHKNMLIDELKTKRKNKEIDDSFFEELKEKYNKPSSYNKVKNNISEIDNKIKIYRNGMIQAKKEKNKNKVKAYKLSIKSSKKTKKGLEKIKKAYIDTKALLRKSKSDLESYSKKEISKVGLKFNEFKNKIRIKKVSSYLPSGMFNEIKAIVNKEFKQPKGPTKIISKKVLKGGALLASIALAIGLSAHTHNTIHEGVDDYKKPDYPDAFSKFMDTMDTNFLEEENNKKENIVTIRVENSNEENVTLKEDNPKENIQEGNSKSLAYDIMNNDELVERIINSDEEEFYRIIEEYYGPIKTKGL